MFVLSLYPTKGLGSRTDEVRVETRHNRDLVIPSDGGKNGPNLRISKGGIEVGRAILRARADPPRCPGTRPEQAQ